MRTFCAVFVAVAFASSAEAVVKTEPVQYKDGDVVLEGVLAYDDASKEKRPGVLVVHDWMGPSAFSTKKAEDLAALGYVAFAVDIYGKGIRPKDTKEAGAQAGKFKSDRALLRQRAHAAYDVLVKHALVDAKRTGAIGFCFGGTTALELMRRGTPLTGVVSFHGGLDAPLAPAKGIQTKVLVLHGADDPFVKPEEISGFKAEMRASKLDWQFVEYANAVHAFTNPNAGNDNSKGAAYNALADKRSWEAMKDFFAEVFAAHLR